MKEFRGRTAVITGGASGIGLATARQLASEGMNIVIADIEERPLQRTVADFQRDGVPVLGVRTDVGDLGQVRALADAAWERFGGVHVLFNNAGVAVGGPLWEMSHHDWEWLMRVNLWGVIHGVEAFLPRMLEGGDEGHIVSTASFAGLVPNTGLGVYCVTKYGVVALAECLARDLRATRIRASVLCPMQVETNIGNSERNRPHEYGGPGEGEADEEPELIPNASPRGGTITAHEVAGRVVQAIRDEELYIVTHPESRQFIRRRFERIDGAFERAGVR